jgi:hypothetical protein
MKKFTKAQNPYAVAKGQIWQRRESARKDRKFTVNRLCLHNSMPYAEVEYPMTKKAKGSIQFIRLDRFKKYRKVSE